MKEIKELLGVVFLTILTLGMAAIPFFLLGLIYGFIGYVAYKAFMFFAGWGELWLNGLVVKIDFQ